MRNVVIIAVSVFCLTWLGCHWWNDFEASNQAEADLANAYATLDATAKGERVAEVSSAMPWPAAHPFIAAGIAGSIVFIVGTLVVIAQNTSPVNRASDDPSANAKPPATS